jgi:Protein of Unknown function (DUF2784)
MWYGYLADAVVIAHVGYVAYVVLGQLAIWLGWILRRQWARNIWFRVTHLIAIVIVALEAAMGWTCPLTNWENQLRVLAGQEVEAGSFLGRLFHRLIFCQCPEGLLDGMHIGFAILVLGTFLLFPPRRPKWLSRRPRAA